MANEEHLAILRQGVEAWNAWREQRRDTSPDLASATLRHADLRHADLRHADLIMADLTKADLAHANLEEADLEEATLSHADLTRADLTNANLWGAHLAEADLTAANLRRADFADANLWGAHLAEADLTGAYLSATVFGKTDLSGCKGLETCQHNGPSIIDFETLRRSGTLPIDFLRGVGLPENVIEYLPSLLGQAFEFYSCFISYSSKDQAFAERLHADLQNKGVRCWFAPHDMPIGAKIIDAIDEAIRLRDKVLLILSEGALASDWVEGEVTRALDEERERKRLLLFPIRLDDAVLGTKEAWARLLRGQRNIGDFTRWKEHDAYRRGLERLLRDLKVEAA